MTTDSVSTMNWVNDRSGAPSSMKISATAKPWMPSDTIAVRRLLRPDDPEKPQYGDDDDRPLVEDTVSGTSGTAGHSPAAHIGT
jgi:hypothetical protein